MTLGDPNLPGRITAGNLRHLQGATILQVVDDLPCPALEHGPSISLAHAVLGQLPGLAPCAATYLATQVLEVGSIC